MLLPRMVLLPRFWLPAQSPFGREALQALLLALVRGVAARRHAPNVALQRVRHPLGILEKALALFKAALRRELVHIADVLV